MTRRLTHRLTRRRFLTVSAAAMALPYGASAKPPVARWRGIALGANASMTLVGLEDTAAREVFTAVEAEIFRLENIFSLHRTDSALSRLNESGKLAAPPPEFLELIALSGVLHRATSGAFDPTVQPLWQLHARRAAEGLRPRRDEIAEAQRRSGWRYLRYDSRSLSFDRPGMALTFNGIAQGYIADRVATLLRARGLTDVLIDMGEIAALGRRPDGTAWRAGIALPDGEVVR
ncbi:FAD:protein FMN transferase, partial [Pelagibius sp.]|uniref:FAD:protein FMN transferase n=1 Tax=Pelagibius sp. TaxID=1931238 RepID=UPI0026213577